MPLARLSILGVLALGLAGESPVFQDPVLKARAARAAAQWLRDRWTGAFAPGGVGRPLFAPEGGTC